MGWIHTLNIAAEHIAEPLTHIFNLAIETGLIPCVLKSAYVTDQFQIIIGQYLSYLL